MQRERVLHLAIEETTKGAKGVKNIVIEAVVAIGEDEAIVEAVAAIDPITAVEAVELVEAIVLIKAVKLVAVVVIDEDLRCHSGCGKS